MTNQVMDHGGVVIDYYGDGLAAMWNAPTETPQHADRAIEASACATKRVCAVSFVLARVR